MIFIKQELMKPVQELLFKQLSSRNQKLNLDLLEKVIIILI